MTSRRQNTDLLENATRGAKRNGLSGFTRGGSRRPRTTALGSMIERLETRSMMAVAPLPPVSPALPIQSLDGTGNNPAHVDWGSTNEQFLRRAAAAYGDGLSSLSGADRPNERLISNQIFANPVGGITNARDMSGFVYAWGQFLDHDLTLSDSAVPAEFFSIAIPSGDPWFDPTGTGTASMPNLRTAYDPATGTSSPRQQVNSLTAFIDGSQVYGSDATRAAALREFVGGRLKTSAGNLLPFNTAGLPNATIGLTPDAELYLAGDVRANENPQLLALHTLFMREHNRLAAEAAARNPGWTDEQLYQHARRIVIAELQDITYTEFLPAVLGQGTPAAVALQAYRGYRVDVNPGISTEFATAAYRFGHSLLGDEVGFLDNQGNEVRTPLSLRNSFFNVSVVSATGIDPILKYLASDRAQEMDAVVIDDVRNFLFGAPGQGGFDLAALNIQRGRDHGLPDYNTVRAAYGLPRLTSFAQISSSPAVQQSLQATYGSVDKVDLWVGGLAETHLPGSSLGATFTRIIVDQFTRLRDGDRFWYQNVLPAPVARSIQATSFSDVIRRNTQLTNLQADVFMFRTSIGGNVFADLNRDGVRQRNEAGLAAASVALVDANGSTIATTQANRTGDYSFNRLDLGSYRVVVTPAGGPAVSSRTVAVTRGSEIRGVNVGIPPKQNPPRPAPAPRPGTPAARAASPTATAFAQLASGLASSTSAPTRR
jgi:peroxidase